MSGSMNRIRVVQYNVRGFVASDGSCTSASICRELKDLNANVVCLNEFCLAKGSACVSKVFREELGGHLVFFGHSTSKRGVFGNAVWSDMPIKDLAKVDLDGGSILEYPQGTGNTHRIKRGLLLCEIDGSSRGMPCFAIGCTHLDHMCEQERITQVEHCLRSLSDYDTLPLLLSGDFNALTQVDYSVEEWSKLEKRHSERNWSGPEPGVCLELLKSRGFRDCFEEAGSGSKWSASVLSPQYRIDYCFASSTFLREFKLIRAFVEQGCVRSDHFPVVFDFVGAKMGNL
mmetsp:Transcript_9416/g.15370  ORF Transcript_9416/g.15370 Transcript_9416/m.15370 type:complete len:287 (-) Transcript_9416:2363-3223(-)